MSPGCWIVRWAPWILVSALAGCSVMPQVTQAPAFDPALVLSELKPPASASAPEAREMLQAVREARAKHAQDFVFEQIDCYKRFLVSGCLEEVAVRGRLLDDRLDAIEVGAQQRLRDLVAVERSQNEAQAAIAWQSGAAARELAEARNRERYDLRQREALEAAAEREAQGPELRRREQAQRERQRERERAFEQRQSQPQPQKKTL